MEEEEKENSAFKVTDRRRFTEEGESRSSEETTEQRTAEEPPPPREEPQAPPRDEDAEPRESQERQLPPLDFATFVLSMANTALFQLGLVPGPDGQTHKDLMGARQTIDIIALLQEKTQGNLTEQEAKIIADTLFQLRMAYVEASR